MTGEYALIREAKEPLGTYGFSKTMVMSSQDGFAGPVRDPEDKYLSTGKAYWRAINEGFDGYNVYKPVDYPDWSVLYTREFVQGKTCIIYNGVLVGEYRHFVVDALYEAVDPVLSRATAWTNSDGALSPVIQHN